MTINLRAAHPTDLPTILMLSDELAQSDLPYDRDIDAAWAHTEDGTTYYRDKISGKTGACWVAEHQGMLVGYITMAIKETPSWRTVTVAELENLFVTARCRRQGIGKRLFDTFIRWAKEQGTQKVAISVFAGNEGALALYRQAGATDYDLTLEMHI